MLESHDSGTDRGGPSGQKNLHPPWLIEQISYEQLLSINTTCFHFIAMDKRSDSICILQLSAAEKLADSCFRCIVTNIITAASYSYSTNRSERDECQAFIIHGQGRPAAHSPGCLDFTLRNKRPLTTQLSESIVVFNSPNITIMDFDNCRT